MTGDRRAKAKEPMPNWPRLMSARLAARYVGLSKTTFLQNTDGETWPRPVRYGRRRLWDVRDLDAAVDRMKEDGSEDGFVEGLRCLTTD